MCYSTQIQFFSPTKQPLSVILAWKPPSGKEDGHPPTGRLFGFPEPRSFLSISKHGTNAISKTQTLVPLQKIKKNPRSPSPLSEPRPRGLLHFYHYNELHSSDYHP